ncbi:CHAT domain-containing protein [uncultured Aquimarina sp.]|uniref:CHAT domain-containing protein n=1 Tax=uncultured Aquimarina sp. TaxID=575652 RepID=UPI0026038E64|nr:CHAT domain-containing protein [uncultured Aquimarina sp.]
MAFLFYFSLPLTISGQQISFALDSIHQLNPEDDHGNIHLYDSLLAHYKKTKNYTQLGSDAHQLAKWLSREGKLDKTIEVLKTGIAARKIAVPFNPELLKRSYGNLGYYYNVKREYKNAMKTYISMIAVEETSIFNEIAYFQLGELYNRFEDPFRSIDYFSKALSIYQTKNDHKKLIQIHYKIASVYRQIKMYGYQEQDPNIKVLFNHIKSADSLTNLLQKPSLSDLFTPHLELGVFYLNDTNTPNQKKAIFHLETALKYAQEMKNERFIIGCYINLGNCYLLSKNFKKSEDYFAKAIDLSQKNNYLKGIAYLGKARSNAKKEKFSDAQLNYKKSIEQILKIKDIKNWNLNLKDITDSNHKEVILNLLYLSKRDYLKQAKQGKNLKVYDTVLRMIKLGDSLVDHIIQEDVSFNTKLEARDSGSEFHNMGLEACLHTDNLNDAFYLMEKSKAVLLMNDIQQQIIALPTDVASKKANYERRIQKLQNELLLAVDSEKDSFTTTIKKIKKRYTRFKDSIELIHPEYSKPSKTPKILPLSEVSVKENEVIIQYSMAERSAGALPHAYVMTLTKDTQKMFEISNVDILIEDIKTLRKLLNQPFKTAEDIAIYRKTSNDIYKSLFPEEIRAVLKGKKVTIIPDHMLGMIPFEALVTNLDNNTYLIEDCEIDYAFSLTFQQQNAKISRTAGQDFLGIAPVNFKQELTPLQNSNKEITAANAFYNGDLLLDQEATKENFIKKIKDYKILHLATHADASDSIAPWIAFRNSKLTDLELNSLQSQAELVVLSACNTSLGKISRGEGILSLARGFFKSGANTVIPSLWSTNDKAIATITADFYKNLSEGQTKSAALRTAKLNYLQNNTDAEASPHYWASMILIGDTGTLLPQSNDLWMFLLGFGIIAAIALSLYVYKRITRV